MTASGSKVALSLDALSDACSYDKERFVFVVENVEYEVSRFQACFFSRKVRRLVAGDVTADRLLVNVVDENDLFGDVVSLMNGHYVTVNSRNSGFLERVCVDLDNQDLLNDVFAQEVESDPLSIGNAIDRLCLKKVIGTSIDDEVDFLACHFDEVVGKFGSLSDDDIDLILGSESLKLVDEDSLLTFVVSRCDVMTGNLPFLRHVRPVFLSEDLLDEYLRHAKDSGLWSIWSVIRECVCGFASSYRGKGRELFPHRYLESESDRLPREEREQDDATKYKNRPFDGIFGHFRSKHGGNIHDNGIVSITSTNTSNYSGPVQQVADRNWAGGWASIDKQNSWILFDFKDNSLCPTHYTLRVRSDWYYPTKWKLEGWSEGDEPTVLDVRDTGELSNNDDKGDNEGHTFSCQSNCRSFRYIRLTQTGRRHGNHKDMDNRFQLSEVEFFGKIRACA